MEERFFYHCFTRQDRDQPQEIEKGLAKLQSMCDIGFLLNPEVIKFSHPNIGDPSHRTAEILQNRISFTELAPWELPDHNKNFGNFTIEYGIDQLKMMGATPVFYVPRTFTNEHAAPLASVLVVHLIDAYKMLQRTNKIKSGFSNAVKDRIDFKLDYRENPESTATYELDRGEAIRTITALFHGIAPPEVMQYSLKGILNYFYHADDLDRNSILAYYRQKEWRICGPFAINGIEQMYFVNNEEKLKLIELDNTLSLKKMTYEGEELSYLDNCLVYPKFDNVHVLEKARRIIVPAGAKAEAEKILSILKNPPKVVEQNNE